MFDGRLELPGYAYDKGNYDRGVALMTRTTSAKVIAMVTAESGRLMMLPLVVACGSAGL